MSDWSAPLVALAGLLLRIGLPLLLSLPVIWILRQLDARWQAEARRLPTSAPPVMRGPACWQANDCAPDRRGECPAFLDAATPCWQHFRDRDGNLRAGCLACELFSGAASAPAQPAERHTAAH